MSCYTYTMNTLPTTSALIDPLLALQHLKVGPAMLVADLGCGGHGHFVFPLADLVGPKGTVYAVDILKTALASIESRARHEHVQQVTPVWTDLEMISAPGIAPATLDRAIIVNALSQSKNPGVMLQRAARLLKKDALLMAIEWRTDQNFFGSSQPARIAPEQLEAGAKAAGFSVVEQFVPGPHHYGFVFKKI